MVHGLRADDGARAEWLAIVDELRRDAEQEAGYRAVFDAIVELHHGRAERALAGLWTEPDEMDERVIWVWRHWYVALRAEAAALTEDPDARRRIAAARTIVAGNPVAGALLDRAEALLERDRDRLLAAAASFDAAGCRYQRARTLVLIGGDHATTGAAVLAGLGLAGPGHPPAMPAPMGTPFRRLQRPRRPDRAVASEMVHRATVVASSQNPA